MARRARSEFFKQNGRNMALDDDLRNYMNAHGQAAIALGAAEV